MGPGINEGWLRKTGLLRNTMASNFSNNFQNRSDDWLWVYDLCGAIHSTVGNENVGITFWTVRNILISNKKTKNVDIQTAQWQAKRGWNRRKTAFSLRHCYKSILWIHAKCSTLQSKDSNSNDIDYRCRSFHSPPAIIDYVLMIITSNNPFKLHLGHIKSLTFWSFEDKFTHI